MKKAFGQKRVFPPSLVTRDAKSAASPYPAAIEKDIERFDYLAIERPTQEIIGKLFQLDAGLAKHTTVPGCGSAITTASLEARATLPRMQT